MSIFPIITHINDLKPHVEHLPEIRFAEQPNGFQIVCAMIADTNTYAGEHAMWARECRGITFDRDGFIVCRGLHKFFNVGERSETQEGILPWANVARLMEKRDGSVINPVKVDGHIVFKSKKSFDSDVALLANKIATLSDKIFSEWCIERSLTPTFELTSPDARIVIKYPVSCLTLLHIRDNHSGRYLTSAEIDSIAINFDINVVKGFGYSADWLSIKYELQTVENFEGYCIQFEDGEIVKAKSKWYLDRHHAMTALTERNVAEMVIAESLDDLKSYIAELGEPDLFEKVEHIESEIVKAINYIAEAVEVLFYPDRELDRKTFAVKHQKHRLFGLLMKRFEGKEPDYKEYYARHLLKGAWEVRSL